MQPLVQPREDDYGNNHRRIDQRNGLHSDHWNGSWRSQNPRNWIPKDKLNSGVVKSGRFGKNGSPRVPGTSHWSNARDRNFGHHNIPSQDFLHQNKTNNNSSQSPQDFHLGNDHTCKANPQNHGTH